MGSTSISCPKGCYQWVVVFCSFFNHMATTGFILSLGVMYVSWLEEFKEAHAKTSWILSVEFALHIGFSPVTASLSSKFGFRAVAFVGGLVTCLGLAIGAFATSVLQLILSVGLVSGIGSSFCFLPPYAMISLIFEKHRSLAIGIATTGVGVGAFALPPLLDHLVNTYAWRGTLLIVSAMTLNMCVTGLLLRPLEMGSMVDVESEDAESCLPIRVFNAEDIMNKDKYDSERKDLSHEQTVVQRTASDNNITASDYRYDLHPQTAIVSYFSLPNLAQHQTKNRFYLSCGYYLHGRDIAFLAGMNGFCAISNASLTTKEIMVEVQTPPAEESSSHRGETEDAPEKSNNYSLSSRLLSWLRELRRLKLFRDKLFLLFCVSNLLANISLLAPVMYLVDRAIHHGIGRSTGAIIISANGVGNILGRLLTGLVASDGCFSNRTLLYILVMCTNGLGTLLSTMCRENAVLHGIYAAYFGFHIGAYMVLTPIVTVDLNGVTNLASVLGQVLAFHGIGILIGPPISGWLFDWTRSYTMSYIINGACLILSGLMVVPLLWKTDKNKFPPMI